MGKDHISQPLVSVVTPVYNGEKYLGQCIESVLAQTYANWEYVIVNNCSTDRTPQIIQDYACRENRIRVHHNCEFLSMIQNGNHALRQISPASKYCKVVHADDWLFPECIARMVEVAEAYPSIGIVSAYRLDNARVGLDGLPYPSTIVPGREICRSTLLGGPYVFGSPTSLLIRSDHIRSRVAFYDEAQFSLHADTAACYETLQHADFGFVHQVLTYTRRPAEAATSYARRMNTYMVAMLRTLKRYGPIYLTPAEYRWCRRRSLRWYYTFLGYSVFQLRDKEFWAYHRNALKNLGESFSVVKLLAGLLLAAISPLLCPVDTLRKAVHLIWRKQGLPYI